MYYKVKENENSITDIRVDVNYDKGQTEYYPKRARGYYVVIVPVKRDGMFESFVAYTGIRQLVQEVKRKSQKAEDTAFELVMQNINSLLAVVCDRNGLELEQ